MEISIWSNSKGFYLKKRGGYEYENKKKQRTTKGRYQRGL